MMKRIRFLIFTSLLAFVLAVFDFDLNEIADELEKYDSVTWEIMENSFKKITIRQIHIKPEKIVFNREKAYIVLQKKFKFGSFIYDIYYLISEGLTISIRLKTVNYVIKLRHTLLAEENEIIKISSEIPFIRETYNYESRGFQDIFFLTRNNRINNRRRLYRITKVNEEIHVQQVPLHFSKLNSCDAFVFDYTSSVTEFNIKEGNADKHITLAAEKVNNFIYFDDDWANVSYIAGCFNWTPRNKECYLQFISKLEGCPEEKFIIKKMLKNTVEEISDNLDYQLFSPTESVKTKMELEFMIKSLETFDFTAKACYVFIMKKVNEAFIYIRDFSISKQVEKCLKFGEEFAVESNYLVSVFHKRGPVTPFIFLFKKFTSMILSKGIGLINFNSLKEDIENELP